MQKNEACGRRYDREFKDNAVALVCAGRTVSQVARDLGVTTWSSGRWVQAARSGYAQSEPKTLATETDEQRELRRLHQSGVRCGKNRVARLTRENHLVPRQKRKRWWPCTTDSRHRRPGAENWLAKMPAPDRPDPVRVADITYLDTGEGWLCLAGILDACTRRLVGWQTGETLGAELVIQAWQKAVRLRRPGPGLLHPSDRGSQYAGGAMATLLAESGAAASMSRQGNCYDNATMESFWATLKAECFHGARPATRQAAKLQVFDHVKGFYNRGRLHSGPGYQFPLAFETNLRYSQN